MKRNLLKGARLALGKLFACSSLAETDQAICRPALPGSSSPASTQLGCENPEVFYCIKCNSVRQIGKTRPSKTVTERCLPDDQIYFQMENQPEAKLGTELETSKVSDKIREILMDLEAIEVLEEPEEGVETSKDEIAETLPEIDTKNTVVEIPDEIDADPESLAMLDWIEAEKAGKMDLELREKVVKSSYVKDILQHGMNKKLKSILKKTSKAEPEITESMLRYILYGEKDAATGSKVTFGINKLNIVEDNFDEEEEDDEEELRRSLEAEEYEEEAAADEKEVAPKDEVTGKVQPRRQLRRTAYVCYEEAEDYEDNDYEESDIKMDQKVAPRTRMQLRRRRTA